MIGKPFLDIPMPTVKQSSDELSMLEKTTQEVTQNKTEELQDLESSVGADTKQQQKREFVAGDKSVAAAGYGNQFLDLPPVNYD
jgi:hypothetical protein